VEALLGTAPALDGVRLADGEVVAVDALFTGARARMASPLAEQLGCAFDDGPVGPVIRTDARKATSVPGVFAAGDATRANGNATMAVADGMMAGTAAHQSLALPAALTSGPAAHRAGTLPPAYPGMPSAQPTKA
jgi:thioredoxin reductase